MQAPKKNKLGSLLSAFEETIRKNEASGASSSSNFLTGIASSPRKLRINSTKKAPNRNVDAKDSGSSGESMVSLDSPVKRVSQTKCWRKSNGTDSTVPCTPLSSALEPSTEPDSNSSCSTTSVESASSIGSATKPLKTLSSQNTKPPLTSEVLENRVQTPVSAKRALAVKLKKTKPATETCQSSPRLHKETSPARISTGDMQKPRRSRSRRGSLDSAPAAIGNHSSPAPETTLVGMSAIYHSPTRIHKEQALRRISTGGIQVPTKSSTRRGSLDSAPAVISNPSPPTKTKLGVTEQQLDSIKRDLMMDASAGLSSPIISPVKRARHRAIRKNVSEGMRERNKHTGLDYPMTPPSRKTSDPLVKPTTGAGSGNSPPNDRTTSPSGGRKRRTTRFMSNTDRLRRKEWELRLRKKAMMYNPHDHGLKGVLKWEKKEPKNLSVQFCGLPTVPPCRKRKSGRRTSLDMTANSDDVTPKQPRRRSMSDIDSTINPLPFLRESLKRNRGLTLFRAVVTSSIMLKRIQNRKAKAAIDIQRIVRGFLQKHHTRILHLEDKLEKNEKARQEDLAKLVEYKHRRRQEIRDKLESKFQKEEEILAKAKELVQYIRKENQTIYEQNEKMATLSDEMKIMNQECRDSTKKLFDNCVAMEEAIVILGRRTNQLVCACKTYEAQIELVSDELCDLDHRITSEKSSRENFQKCVERLVETTNAGRNDVTLQVDIQNLCKRVHEDPDQTPTDRNCIINSNAVFGFGMQGAADCSLCPDASPIFDPDETLFVEKTFATVGLSMSDDDSMSFGNYTFDDEEDAKTFCSVNTSCSVWTDYT